MILGLTYAQFMILIFVLWDATLSIISETKGGAHKGGDSIVVAVAYMVFVWLYNMQK
jgi:hypothetical protein